MNIDLNKNLIHCQILIYKYHMYKNNMAIDNIHQAKYHEGIMNTDYTQKLWMEALFFVCLLWGGRIWLFVLFFLFLFLT